MGEGGIKERSKYSTEGYSIEEDGRKRKEKLKVK